MPHATLLRRLAELGLAPLDGPAGEAGQGGTPIAAGGPAVPRPIRVAPGTLQQAADLLGTCSREGWHVRLAGTGSRVPDSSGARLVISSQALVGLDVHVPDDLTAGVFAGTSHAALEQALAQHRQILPLDPLAPDDATLGGTFAAGSAGPLRAGYGTPRDLALGIQAVTADGRVLRLGGQVVKNVAGYDLVRLLVGSRGTLAFLAQVHVRLRSAPAADATLLASARSAPEAADLALRLRDTLHPVALELLGPRGGEPWRLALRLHGSAAVVDAAAARVRDLLPDAVRLEPPAAADFWARLRRAEGGAGTRIRLQGPAASLARLLELAGRITAADPAAGEWSLAAHAADGVVRVVHPTRSPAGAARLAALLPALADEVASIHGTCICEAGAEALRSAAPAPAPAAAIARIEAELRQRFDPAGILVGG